MDEQVSKVLEAMNLESTDGNWESVAALVRRKGKGKGKKGGGKVDVTCYHCGKTGHLKRDCWELDKMMNQQRQEEGAKGKWKR